jgi:hypothetical protein
MGIYIHKVQYDMLYRSHQEEALGEPGHEYEIATLQSSRRDEIDVVVWNVG